VLHQDSEEKAKETNHIVLSAAMHHQGENRHPRA
jgi:hypothetical protein